MAQLLLALDIGTTAIKAGCFTPEGQALGTAYVEYPLLHPARNHVEQEAEQWWELSRWVIQHALDQSKQSPLDVAALSISAQGITFVPVDRAGRPLHNAFSWLDTRAITQTAELLAFFSSQEAAFYRVGLHVIPTYTLPKIMWLRDHRPDVFHNAACFSTCLDFMNARLVGHFVTDHSIAGGTLAHNLSDLSWDRAVLDAAGVPVEKLPGIGWSGTLLGTLRPAASAAFGLPEKVEVVLGGHDQEVAALGAGLKPAELTISLGTASILVAPLNEPVSDPHLRIPCYPHVEQGQFVLEAVVSTAGISFRWLRDLFNSIATESSRSFNYEALVATAATVPPGANGVSFYPHLSGATSPFWNPDTSGTLHGLSLASGKAEVVRAVLEGWCFQLRTNLLVIEELTPRRENVIIFGGGARSPFIQQLLADILGRPIVVSPTADTTLLGAAMLAGLGAGIYYNLDEARAVAREGAQVVTPHATTATTYGELYHDYRQLEDHLLDAGRLSEEKDSNDEV